jgi:hypothetical protein
MNIKLFEHVYATNQELCPVVSLAQPAKVGQLLKVKIRETLFEDFVVTKIVGDILVLVPATVNYGVPIEKMVPRSVVIGV